MDYNLPPTWESADNFYQSAKKAYDVTQQMKKGNVGVGDFTAFAQSLIVTELVMQWVNFHTIKSILNFPF